MAEPGTGELRHSCAAESTEADGQKELRDPYSLDISAPAEASEVLASTYRKFHRILNERVVDIDGLKQLCWKGVPAELRTLAWQLMMGYLPANQDRRKATLKRKRAEYETSVQRLYYVPAARMGQAQQKEMRQIKVDIPRTQPGIPLFAQDAVRDALERVLYVWAARHPATGYVQGMNDVASALLLAFLNGYVGEPASCDVESLPAHVLPAVEADTFWCLNYLLDTIQDHYVGDQPGIQRMIYQMTELTRRTDARLLEHLEREQLSLMMFAMPWMNNLLIRQLPLVSVLRLWDAYFAEENGFDSFHVYFCVAFLQHFSAALCEMPFSDMFMHLQAPPTQDWGDDQVDDLLSQAFMLKALFGDAPNHLQR